MDFVFKASLVVWANWSRAEAADVSSNVGFPDAFLMVLNSVADADFIL